MTILSATTPPITAARTATATATAAKPVAASDAMDGLFQANLAEVSGEAAASTADAAAVPEKSISFVSRGSKSGVLSPTQQFESFVLRSFVDSMLPQNDSEYFGTGTAGKIWKSMLAEQIGNQMAKDGGIGIADMLEKHGPHAAALKGASDKLKDKESLVTGAQAFKGLGPS